MAVRGGRRMEVPAARVAPGSSTGGPASTTRAPARGSPRRRRRPMMPSCRDGRPHSAHGNPALLCLAGRRRWNSRKGPVAGLVQTRSRLRELENKLERVLKELEELKADKKSQESKESNSRPRRPGRAGTPTIL